MTRSSDSANNEFILTCLDIDELLGKLAAHRAEHFGADAEQPRNWAEVGTAKHVRDLLAQAVAFIEGTEA